ncbi:tyrosine-type recombinase/integrase [Halosimplex pelagicum]|uniref:Tyrosine-type recombinase/integrase n=1 Tax=Halosimplex pelagicum TaxID=869886 RepID=A0A7D5P517_9EURY|nr:tyrosine-type recombinase/integrase [Halosimplex pelagicum]QLH81017.1 tyrosine-type recombinase/integrase [Halosimplex pelagicum]
MADSDPRDEVDTLRDRLESGERYVQFEPDREHLLQMSDNIRLLPSQIGAHRHLKLLRHTSRMAQLAQPPTVGDFEENDEADAAGVTDEDDVETLLDEHGLLGLTLDYRAAADAIVRWIHGEYDNEHTNQDYRTALRSWGRYRLKTDEPPETLAWIPTGTSNNFDPTPSERDLLTQPDVEAMIDACHNDRDKALIAVQFEAGLRGGELYDLRVGDIFDGDHSTGIHVDGKEGERTVHLIWAVPWLQDWVSEHPTGDTTDYLWAKLSDPDRPSYNTWLGYFKAAAERAGVSKDVTPTNLRKSNTRWLIKRGLKTPRIEDRQGRERGSEHTARYLARFGDESNERAYAQVQGVEVEADDEGGEVAPVPCPRCGELVPRHRDFCEGCRFSMDLEAQDLLDTVDELIDERVVDADDAATREDLVELRSGVKSDPSRLDKDDLHDLASSLSFD